MVCHAAYCYGCTSCVALLAQGQPRGLQSLAHSDGHSLLRWVQGQEDLAWMGNRQEVCVPDRGPLAMHLTLLKAMLPLIMLQVESGT